MKILLASKFLALRVSLVLVLASSPSVGAASIYQTLQAPFYDPNSGALCDPTSENVELTCVCIEEGNDTTLSGAENVEKAFNYFLSKGFSKEQAAGILGNLKQESGVMPARVEEGWGFPDFMRSVPPNTGPQGQPGYGLAQWTSPGRKQNLSEFAKKTGRPVYTLGLQLDFIMEEMKSYPGLEEGLKKLSGSNAILDATFLFHDVYEGSADTYSEVAQNRGESAKAIFAKYSGLPSSQPGIQDDVCSTIKEGSTNTTITSGSKQELAQSILNSKNVVFGNYGNASQQRDDINNCLTDTTLAAFATMADKSGTRILVNALGTDHGGCNGKASGNSAHNYGRAIDIGYYGNGGPNHNANGDALYKFLYNNSGLLEIDQLIWTRPPAGYKCIGKGTPVDCLAFYGFKTVSQHTHHIHVGFKK